MLMKQFLMNIQGTLFASEKAAKEYYGSGYKDAILQWVEMDEDMNIIDKEGNVIG